MMDFSVVVPVSENDAALGPRTLPRWLALPADELIRWVDKPAGQRLIEAIRKKSRGDDRLRVVEVPRESGWMFHQAFVRRTGFKSARFDKILTGDIDVIVNENVVAAILMVGKDNIGIVSRQKVMRSGFFDVVQTSTRRVIGAFKK